VISQFQNAIRFATLNRDEMEGKIAKTFYADPGSELLKKLGLGHGQKILAAA